MLYRTPGVVPNSSTTGSATNGTFSNENEMNRFAFKTGEFLRAGWDWLANFWKKEQPMTQETRQQAFEKSLQCTPGEIGMLAHFREDGEIKSSVYCSSNGNKILSDTYQKSEADVLRIQTYGESTAKHCMPGNGNLYYPEPGTNNHHICQEDGSAGSVFVLELSNDETLFNQLMKLIDGLTLSENAPDQSEHADTAAKNENRAKERKKVFLQTGDCSTGDTMVAGHLGEYLLENNHVLKQYAVCLPSGDIASVLTTSDKEETADRVHILLRNQCLPGDDTIYRGFYERNQNGIALRERYIIRDSFVACHPDGSVEELDFEGVKSDAMRKFSRRK